MLAWAMSELHEVHQRPPLQQLRSLYRLPFHAVPAHPSHHRPALPLPSRIYRRLLRDWNKPVLLKPLHEWRSVRSQGGRLHLHLPRGLHRWEWDCVSVRDVLLCLSRWWGVWQRLAKEHTLRFTLAKNRPLMAGSHCQNKQQHFKCSLKLAVGYTVWWESCSYCPTDSNRSNKPNNFWHLMFLG